MHTHPSQPSVLLSLSLTERVVSGVGNAVHAAGAPWGDYTARRDARAVDAIANMNAHMLRDIGVHDRLIAQASARKDADHRGRIVFALSTPLWMATLISAATLGAGAEAADSRSTGNASPTAELIGSFTGEYVHGAPVYRLPPVIVVARRKVEQATPAREEQSTRAQQARAKAAARKPA